jgi:diguanylate cyclase (GGDEF)-like protein/PAS domain S-box-containing protein
MREQAKARPEIVIVHEPGPAELRQLTDLVAMSRDVLALLDPPAVCRAVSPSCEHLLGRTPEELAGLDALSLVHPADLGDVRASVQQLLDGGRPLSLRFRMVHRDGSAVWVHAYGAPPEPGGATYGVVLRDVTERMEFEELMHEAALHDPVTGLANRRMLDDALAAAVARSERSHQPLAALFTDLDRFKELNDTYGHATGDEVLRVVGRRLRGVTRAGDLVARYGGDEFVTIVLDAQPPVVARAADRIRAAVRRTITSGGHLHRVTASVGVAVWREGMTADELLVEADRAMYAEKRR